MFYCTKNMPTVVEYTPFQLEGLSHVCFIVRTNVMIYQPKWCDRLHVKTTDISVHGVYFRLDIYNDRPAD